MFTAAAITKRIVNLYKTSDSRAGLSDRPNVIKTAHLPARRDRNGARMR
jgi:hypothetical protein